LASRVDWVEKEDMMIRCRWSELALVDATVGFVQRRVESKAATGVRGGWSHGSTERRAIQDLSGGRLAT